MSPYLTPTFTGVYSHWRNYVSQAECAEIYITHSRTNLFVHPQLVKTKNQSY